jgi:DedD protein
MRTSSQTAQVSSPVASGGTEHRAALRDLDRWKEKIEIRLDNRQVAFLFFGSALIACLLFILGVVVGKRLESRGHAMAPDIEDPLALLDRVASTVAPTQVPRSFGEVAISRAHASTSASISARPSRPLPERKVAVVTPPAPPAEVVIDEAPVRAEPKAPKKVVNVVPPPVAELPTKVVPALPKAVETPVARAAAVAPQAATPEILPPSGMSKPGMPAAVAGRPRFMLQVGSFAQRAEAEAFASGFAGERPIVVASELPGKGTWYRIRVGGFANFKEAVDAKLAFERRYNKIALVIGPL